MIIVFVKKASNGDLNLLLSLEGDRRQEGKEGRGGEERRKGESENSATIGCHASLILKHLNGRKLDDDNDREIDIF